MKPLAKVFTSLFGAGAPDHESARIRQMHREWDRMRSQALTPAEREEIDAIFSRNL
jgi:hypothetical protein